MFGSSATPVSRISSWTGLIAPLAAIMVAVPTSNIWTMCGVLPARNAAMAATIVSGYCP